MEIEQQQQQLPPMTPLTPYRQNSKNRTKVQVSVRVRPFLMKEIENSQRKCLKIFKEENLIAVGSSGKYHNFKFDHIFDSSSSQNEIYQQCASELIENTFDGYNATIFAYGQTGSGKTYTMGTQDLIISECKEKLGIIPRVIEQIFLKKKEIQEKTRIFLKVTFIEIYNEEIHDLLDQQGSIQCGIIREDKDGQITLCGLNEQSVNSFEQMKQCLELGTLHRKTSSTLLNESSSRSHAIFSILMTQEDVETSTLKMSKLHLVDLAGSERLSKTHAQGITQREGININKGLLALGNVIVALTEPHNNNTNRFVPYRDSKLTRILQDSLGGNSLTSMIACVSPAEDNLAETLSTLNYAFRAMNIQNIVNPNMQKNSQEEICQLKKENKALQAELATLAVSKQTFLQSESIQEKLQADLDHKIVIIEQLQELIRSNGIQIPEQIEQNSLSIELKKVQEKLKTKESDYKELEREYKKLSEQQSIERQLLNRKQQKILQLKERLNYLEYEDDEIDEENDEEPQQIELDPSAAKEIDLLEGTLSIKQQDLETKEAYLTELQQNIEQSLNQNYKEKIAELIDQRDNAIKKLGINSDKSQLIKYKQNIQELEVKLAEFKRKEKVQERLIKQINDQKEKVKSLTDEIKQIKTQKAQLQKNYKSEQNKYQKLQQEKNREYLQMKRKNLQKDNQILKLQNEHKLKQMRLQRKTTELENRLLSSKLLQNILHTKKGNNNKKACLSTSIAFNRTLQKFSEQSKYILSEQQVEQLIEFSTSRLLQSLALEQYPINEMYRWTQFEGKWKDVEQIRKKRKGIRAKKNHTIDEFLKNKMEKLEEIMMSVPRKKQEIYQKKSQQQDSLVLENYQNNQNQLNS